MTINELIKEIAKLTPAQRLSVYRGVDRNQKDILVYYDIKVKEAWSPREMANILDVDKSTILRWAARGEKLAKTI